MRLQAESTQAYRGDVLVQTPARARRPRASASLHHEARLAYNRWRAARAPACELTVVSVRVAPGLAHPQLNTYGCLFEPVT